MNADAFRHLYEYHFRINRLIWDYGIVPLTDEQFLQPIEYSLGSIRNHVVHMRNVDMGWFGNLQGDPDPSELDENTTDRATIRASWDEVEAFMRAYLAEIHDDMLLKVIDMPNDPPTPLWQVLIHVANHGTDHRAQLLRLINDVGGETFPQDYMFFIRGMF